MLVAADTESVPATRSLVLLVACLFATAAVLGVASDRAQAVATAGVQLHVLWEDVDADEMERQLQHLEDLGAGMARVDVGWGSLQAEGPGEWDAYHLERLDRLVERADAHDVDLLLTLADSPCWASSAPRTLKGACSGRWWKRNVHRYLPEDPDDYARALAFLARRYGERVKAWEIWNEPNSEAFSGGPRKAARYAAVVRAAYARAKPIAPHATFVAGAVSEADTEFVDALYEAGIRGAYDAFSMHPYSQDVSPVDRRVGGNQRLSFATGVPAMRQIMRRHGDDAPVWLTEFGWSTSTVRNRGPFENGVDEDRQALFVRQALDHVRSLSYVDAIVYYNLKDRSADRSIPVDNYGLLRRDGSRKPAFRAFERGVRDLEAIPSEASPPTVDLQPARALAPTLEVRGPGARSAFRRRGVVQLRRTGGGLLQLSGTATGRRSVGVAIRRASGGRDRGLRLRLVVDPDGSFRGAVAIRRLPRGTHRVRLTDVGLPAPTVRVRVR